ncbi:hypothetical protein E2C01_007457 [Portunus trituberculatus]|uniref:Uncharacterized protein n=1 Tax=Portunus trituberculatus TaxID=210409 RepID=A0A5B7D2G8_PORTR|nr:hypothetical protein [Portunus trituberculatus]
MYPCGESPLPPVPPTPTQPPPPPLPPRCLTTPTFCSASGWSCGLPSQRREKKQLEDLRLEKNSERKEENHSQAGKEEG